MIPTRLFLPSATAIFLLKTTSSFALSTIRSSDHDLLFQVCAASAATTVSIYCMLYLRTIWSLKFAGPIPLPLIGNMLSLIAKGNMQDSARALAKTYGKVVDLLLVDGVRMVLVNDANAARSVMKSTDRGFVSANWKSNFREKFVWKDLYGNNGFDVFSRSNKLMDWKSHRRLLQPAFDQKHVRAMLDAIESSVEHLVSRIPTNEVIDILPLLQDLGLDVIFRTSFGESIRDDPKKRMWLVQYFKNVTSLYQDYFFDPFLYISSQILPLLGLNAKELERRKNTPIFRQYCRDLVTKEQIRQKNKSAKDDEGVDNFLSILVAKIDGNNFTVDNVIDELVAFTYAGYDTSSVTLSNLLYHIASNPSSQQKVQKELDDLVANKDNFSYADLIQQTPYLSACIRESQRLQPIAPLISRRIEKDVQVTKEDGSTISIPSGTIVYVQAHLLQHDEKQYPDPDSFKPERWLNAKTNGLNPTPPGYFFAFGAGPKMCIGYQLAEKEVKMAAAGVLLNYKVTSREEVKIVDNFVTGPEKVMLEFVKRE